MHVTLVPQVVARLVDAYLGGRGSAAAAAESGAIAAIEERLADFFARGRAAHPKLAVEDVAFAAHLGRVGAVVDGPRTAETQAADLFLCCAALQGDDLAVRILRDRHHGVIASYIGPIDSSPSFFDEVEQRLWDSALIGSADRAPKLLSYVGRGPLGAWIGVAAQRIALMMRRSEAAEQRAFETVAREARSALEDPELAFIKETLREPFERALVGALASLDDRQRMIYRLHVVDGLTVDRIGAMYGVSHSTISRWLAGARTAIVAEARRLLQEEAHVSPEEFDSLARLLASGLDLSASLVLRGSEVPPV